MSYILDALRRADAERERGGVPGLHTQAMADPGDDDGAPRPRGLKPWQWMVIGLAGGLAVAVVWQWPGAEPAPPPLPAPAPPAPPAIAAAPPAQAPPTPAAAPVHPAAIAPMRAAPPPPEARAAARLTGGASATATAATASAVPPAPMRVNSLAELPADVRAALPALAFGGSIYSNTPANRLLIVNGQLMHEGDALGPGATLEQIKPKAAVLNIRGQRYEIGL